MIHHLRPAVVDKALKIQVTSCPLYAIPRATLAAGVIHILQKNSLSHLANQSDLYSYGHRSLMSVDNRKLLLSIRKYIKDTQDFSTAAFKKC